MNTVEVFDTTGNFATYAFIYDIVIATGKQKNKICLWKIRLIPEAILPYNNSRLLAFCGVVEDTWTIQKGGCTVCTRR